MKSLKPFSAWWETWKTNHPEYDADTRAAIYYCCDAREHKQCPEDNDDERLRDIINDVTWRASGSSAESEDAQEAMAFLVRVAELSASGLHQDALSECFDNLDGLVAVARMYKRGVSLRRSFPKSLEIADKVQSGGRKGASLSHGSPQERQKDRSEIVEQVRRLRAGDMSYTKATDETGQSFGITGKAIRKRLGRWGKDQTAPRK